MIFEHKKNTLSKASRNTTTNNKNVEKNIYNQNTKKKKPKLSMKIEKFKLPKDFFHPKTVSKTLHTNQNLNTYRESQFNTKQNQTNETPRFRESKHKAPTQKPERSFRLSQPKVLISNSTELRIKNNNSENPIREVVSTQLRFIKQFSCKKYRGQDFKMWGVQTSRLKLQPLYQSEWQRSKKLPPINFNQISGQTCRRVV